MKRREREKRKIERQDETMRAVLIFRNVLICDPNAKKNIIFCTQT